jgi:hypothetical protein
MKVMSGSKRAVFSGLTEWNWEQEPYGFFKITVKLSRPDLVFLNPALSETIKVFDVILNSAKVKNEDNNPINPATGIPQKMPDSLAV